MAIPKVGSPTDIPEPVPSVDELCISFWRHAEQHYGKSTSEVHCYRLAIKLLRELYGRIPAKDFGPLGLKAVRAKMMGLGSARGNITVMVGRLRRTFKHAVENEMVDAAVPTQQQAAAPLLAGRIEARDNALRNIETVRQRVQPLVRDLIDMQLLTDGWGTSMSVTSCRPIASRRCCS